MTPKIHRSFRLSSQAIVALEDAASSQGISQAEVLENLILAKEIPVPRSPSVTHIPPKTVLQPPQRHTSTPSEPYINSPPYVKIENLDRTAPMKKCKKCAVENPAHFTVCKCGFFF